MNWKNRKLSGLIALLIVAFASLNESFAAQETQARKILDATGVQGGLVVHLGCGDGRLTAALAASDAYVVHGLDTEETNVKQAREHIRSLGLYGHVSVELRSGSRLPYAEDLVSLLVAEDLSDLPMAEVMRVLAPHGVAYIKKANQWTAIRKPRPSEIADWTHYMHDASGNAVSRDTRVRPPRRVQWIAPPVHNRSVKTSAMVSAGGRVFYVLDTAHPQSNSAQWMLIARDAFNGVVLWQRELNSWRGGGRKKTGPAQITRTLVADDERVYFTSGAYCPLSILDASTGATLHTVEGTDSTEEIIATDNIVLTLVNRKPPPSTTIDGRHAHALTTMSQEKVVVAVDAQSGQVLWENASRLVLPQTLAAAAGRVFYHDGHSVVCLDLQRGEPLWQSAPIAAAHALRGKQQWVDYELRRELPDRTSLLPWYAPTLIAQNEVVLYAASETLTALSAKTGEKMWTGTVDDAGYSVPLDVMVIDGLVWSPYVQRMQFVARDLRTGEVRKQLSPKLSVGFTHHRCNRIKAVGDCLITSRAGVEFIDTTSETMFEQNWLRGSCNNGVMPANGLLYVPPTWCSCWIRSKIAGMYALGPESRTIEPVQTAAARLVKGPAFDSVEPGKLADGAPHNWLMYRGDSRRSGASRTSVDAELRSIWQIELDGQVSSPVISGDRVFVACSDSHTIRALCRDDGHVLWSRTVGGRVDSPPTIHAGMAIFGSKDGSVYCLRASDGELVWSFLAAPYHRRIMANGQLESAWPVAGSVLAHDDSIYFAAGRSSYLDGGIYLFRLDARDGRVLAEHVVTTENDSSQKIPSNRMEQEVGALADVLSTDGTAIYMRHKAYDAATLRPMDESPHLYSPTGFLDDSWFDRVPWIYGTVVYSMAGGDTKTKFTCPSGRILTCNDETVFGFGNNPYPDLNGRTIYRLFAANKDLNSPTDARRDVLVDFLWSRQMPINVWAMVLANGTLFAAGPTGNLSPDMLDGNRPGRLFAVSASDGETLAEYSLDAMPVWDGMAAAQGRLFLSLKNGQVVCYGK